MLNSDIRIQEILQKTEPSAEVQKSKHPLKIRKEITSISSETNNMTPQKPPQPESNTPSPPKVKDIKKNPYAR
jgi:hypothetical protein